MVDAAKELRHNSGRTELLHETGLRVLQHAVGDLLHHCGMPLIERLLQWGELVSVDPKTTCPSTSHFLQDADANQFSCDLFERLVHDHAPFEALLVQARWSGGGDGPKHADRCC